MEPRLDYTKLAPEAYRTMMGFEAAVTRLTEGHVPDYVYQEARRHFSGKELVDLTMAIVAINVWNRLNIAFQTVAGSYQPEPVRQQTGSAS
jgi:alkylhydroperoxidase family enzyme